ncbi:hypothetical protein LJB96_04080 [Methanobrevibacter sp. OttesenSCG-928-K11]|nr:hypothetical protein [Methanobrevibacter sp. OttesenSCG-928-K11]
MTLSDEIIAKFIENIKEDKEISKELITTLELNLKELNQKQLIELIKEGIPNEL